MKQNNQILKLEELNLEKMRNKQYENRIEAFEDVERLIEGVNIDKRNSSFRVEDIYYSIRFKKQNKKFVLDFIVTDGEVRRELNENGIMCVIPSYIFYR